MTRQDAPDSDRVSGSADGHAGRPGGSESVATLRAVTIGALLVIAGSLVLDATPELSSDQRLLGAGIAALLAALLGISTVGYRRRE